MVWTFRPKTNTRPILQPKPSFLLLLLWNLQPFTSPDPFHTLRVHMPASVVQQACYHAIAIAPALIGQLDDVFRQTIFIGATLWHFPLGGSVLTKCAAGPALGDAKLLAHMINALPAT